MGYHCDHCGEELSRNQEGFFVDSDGSTACLANEHGHAWEGRVI